MIIRGDARTLPLRDQTVQCVVTSPPYFQLRDYRCGERQIGLEATPEAYIADLVEVFREVHRVLRADGVLWLILGDCYWGTNSSQRSLHHPTLKSKDLIGIPWRIALALQADGWYLRADVIWAKPNPMPEPTRDRPTRSHEYVFLLSKSRRYFYDAGAIAEPAVSDHPSANRFRRPHGRTHGNAATTLSGPLSAGHVIAAMSGSSGASRPPKHTMRRSLPSSPGGAFWPVHGLPIWSSIPSPAREQSARSVKNYRGNGSESTYKPNTLGLPDAAPLKWDFCFDVFRVAKRPVYPDANGGDAVFFLGWLPEGLSLWGKPARGEAPIEAA